MRVKQSQYPKRKQIEQKRGDLKEYFRQAIRSGMTQKEMAEDLGVTKVTCNKWLREYGFRFATTYVEAA